MCDTDKKDFHLKEYESLKKEIADLVEHSRKLEIYAVGGIAAFYAWFIGEVPKPSQFALYIPMLIVLLGAYRSLSVLTRIDEIAEYLRKVESVFALKLTELGLIGWETALKQKNSSPFVHSAVVFWSALGAASFVALLILS